MTPYSALAGGRLSKHPGETSSGWKRTSYARFKYDATAQQDSVIINRVAELADKRGVSMTEISLAWLLQKVTAPVVGATSSTISRARQRRWSCALPRRKPTIWRSPMSPTGCGSYGSKYACRHRVQQVVDRQEQ